LAKEKEILDRLKSEPNEMSQPLGMGSGGPANPVCYSLHTLTLVLACGSVWQFSWQGNFRHCDSWSGTLFWYTTKLNEGGKQQQGSQDRELWCQLDYV